MSFGLVGLFTSGSYPGALPLEQRSETVLGQGSQGQFPQNCF